MNFSCYTRGYQSRRRWPDWRLGRGGIFAWPVGVTGKEKYSRSTLSVGDVSITIYIHESLAPENVLKRLVEHYKAWAVNMPGGRR